MQIRNLVYHDLDASQTHNRKFINVVKPGVYKGYRVRRNSADPTMIDVTHGGDFVSVLVTSEGVRIQETAELVGVLRFEAADTTYSRYDLVVAEYQWVPNSDVQQLYKIVKGRYPRTPDEEPVRPSVQNTYQTPLAYVLVKPLTAQGGHSRVSIAQEDIFHVPQASTILAPEEMSSLRPVLDPTNAKRIFVYPGRFPMQSGVGYVDFVGAYSEEIDDSAMVDGETRYFLFGVCDDSTVQVAAQSDVPSIEVDIGANALPICIGKVYKTGGSAMIVELIDVRFPFSRKFVPRIEEDFYYDFLSQSVFKYLRLDSFREDTFIDLASLSPVDANLTAKFNPGETSLEISWAGSAEPAADVTLATNNLLDGSEISGLRHIMLLIDTDAEGVLFDYSATSAYSGFTGRTYEPDTIVELPGGINQLFIKLIIPKTVFPSAVTKRIFSYAVAMVLDYETLNDSTISALGVESLVHAIPNLLPNGDFRVWSRPNSILEYPDIDSRDIITYPAFMSGMSSKTNIFAADGWQFTKMAFEAKDRTIARVLWSRDVLGSIEENTLDTALRWNGSAGGSTSGAENYLEFRVPVSPLHAGQFITFAFDFFASQKEAIGIRLALYERNPDGSFVVQNAVQSGAIQPYGTLILRSGAAINERTYAVGFIIVFQQMVSETTVYVKAARAAIGWFDMLPFIRPVNADDLIRAYYERGAAMASANVEQGEEIGSAVQFGAVKLLGLCDGGVVQARETGVVSGNRNVNLGQFALAATRFGITARGQAMVTGLSVVDVDWGAEVVYPAAS
jgi:hypothetical protein